MSIQTPPAFALRDYQERTVSALLSPPEGVTRSLCVMATGGGKTVVFAALLDQLLKPGERGLVLAHREELLTQARDKIAFAAPTLHVEIEQAASRASRTHPQDTLFEDRQRAVVVGSVQTMQGRRLESWERDAFSIVIIDEAHHALAESYLAILAHFNCLPGSTRLVGVTATPGRTDGVGLGRVFQEIAVEYGIRDLIARKHLVPIRAWQVATQTNLAQIKITAGDYAAGQLEEAVNNDPRNFEIVAAYERYAMGMQGVIFCAGVAHAKDVADRFNDRGIKTEAVWGDMPKEERQGAFERYHSGATRLLSNMNLLTEGWDAPQTQCIVLARPTKSELLFTQMLGRGLRLHPGKDHMVAIDLADITSGKGLVTVSSLVGMPKHFDPQGGNVFDMEKDLEEIDPRLQRLATDRETLDKIITKVKAGLSVAEIDLFAAISRDVTMIEFSNLGWLSVGKEHWRLRADTNKTYEIRIDTLGKYVISHVESGEILGKASEKIAAFSRTDKYISQHHFDKIGYLDVRARWREGDASEKQLELLARIARGMKIPEGLTKGDASILIDSIMQAKQGRRAARAN